MSKIRKYLTSDHIVNSDVPRVIDFDYVLGEWDIPLDQNLTAHEANMWLTAQLDHNFRIVPTSPEEGMDGDQWDEAVEFVWRCLRHGVVPHEYVNLLISRQQMCDKWFA